MSLFLIILFPLKVGSILGRQGSVVKEIMSLSGTSIQVRRRLETLVQEGERGKGKGRGKEIEKMRERGKEGRGREGKGGERKGRE